MSYKLIPEVALTKILKSLKTLMRIDYAQNTNKDNTILADLFKDIALDKFDFYEQAVFLFNKKKDDRTGLEITMGYNMERSMMPTIHIILPSEQPKVAPIGGNRGYEQDFLGQDNDNQPYGQEVYTYENIVTYNLLITSGNVLETVLIYNWLKYMFTSIYYHFELAGFRNVQFGGSDLLFDENLMPRNAFHRNFNLQFEYEYSAKDIARTKIATGIIIEQVLLAPDENSYEEFLEQRQPFNN